MRKFIIGLVALLASVGVVGQAATPVSAVQSEYCWSCGYTTNSHGTKTGMFLTTFIGSGSTTKIRGLVWCTNGGEYVTSWVTAPTVTTVYRYCPTGYQATAWDLEYF